MLLNIPALHDQIAFDSIPNVGAPVLKLVSCLEWASTPSIPARLAEIITAVEVFQEAQFLRYYSNNRSANDQEDIN